MEIEHLHRFLSEKEIILAFKGLGVEPAKIVKFTGVDRQRVYNILRHEGIVIEGLHKQELYEIARFLHSPDKRHAYISLEEMVVENPHQDPATDMEEKISRTTAMSVLRNLASDQRITAYEDLMRNVEFAEMMGYQIQDLMEIIIILKDSFKRAKLDFPDSRLEEWLNAKKKRKSEGAEQTLIEIDEKLYNLHCTYETEGMEELLRQRNQMVAELERQGITPPETAWSVL